MGHLYTHITDMGECEIFTDLIDIDLMREISEWLCLLQMHLITESVEQISFFQYTVSYVLALKKVQSKNIK